MAGGGCFRCLRFLVLSLNLLVLLCGLGLAGLGVWLVAEEHFYLGTVDLFQLSLASLSLLGTGLAIIVFAALGCCGALTSSRCLLGTFSLLLVALAFAQLSIASLIYFKQIDYGVVIEQMTRQTVLEKYQANNTATVLYWDHVQRGLHCCGADGPEDWAESKYGKGKGEAREIGIGMAKEELPFSIPNSCCKEAGNRDCHARILGKEARAGAFFTAGCTQSLVKVLGDHLMYILAAGAGVLLIELLGVSLSLCLCCTLARFSNVHCNLRIEARKA